MANEEQTFYPKDFEYLFVLNPNKMSTDEIVNYINSCSNGSDKMFIYNAFYFMLKQIPGKPIVSNTEKALGDKKLRESAKRELISNLKYSSAYCDVWLSPQEKFMNYLKNLWTQLFAKIKPGKYDYGGYIYTISRQEISGWVMNRINPEEKVMVDIYGDYKKKLSVCADLFGEDLKMSEIGDGFHAFRISPVPEELLQCSNIQARTQNDGYLLIDNYLGIFRESLPLPQKYVGYIYTISHQEISGWAMNTASADEKVLVDIYGDDQKKLSVYADLFREDLKINGIGDGFHAFCVSPLPEELLQCSTITVKTKEEGFTLIDECLGSFRDKYQYGGHIYTISRQEISGWVMNATNLEERVIVDIYGDNEKKLSVCADLFREDLKINNVGDGFHAFSISPVPEDLLKCSTITVKTRNNGYTLIDSHQGVFRD
jgi:hypothetical protein